MNLWTLNRLIVLMLIGAFAGLLFEIRAEHQDVLGEHAIAWTPIVYSGLMIILSLAALFFWQRGGRQILFWAFAAALIVGVVGFWQHNEHNFGKRIGYVLTVWGDSTDGKHQPNGNENPAQGSSEQPPQQAKNSHEMKAPILPPVFAPLTFAGLGILGMHACAKRFEREQTTQI